MKRIYCLTLGFAALFAATDLSSAATNETASVSFLPIFG